MIKEEIRNKLVGSSMFGTNKDYEESSLLRNPELLHKLRNVPNALTRKFTNGFRTWGFTCLVFWALIWSLV